MDKGFFIVVVKRKKAGVGVALKGGSYWRADLVHAIRGWNWTGGENIEAAIDSQKEQYHALVAANQPVPELVSIKCGPMAAGQTVRFVPVK